MSSGLLLSIADAPLCLFVAVLQVEAWKEHAAEGKSMSVGKAFFGDKKDE